MNNRSLTTILHQRLRTSRHLRAAVCPPPLPRLASLLSLLLALLLAIPALLSCERRPLEVVVEPKARVIVKLDWLDQFGKQPNGMLMLVYNEADTLLMTKGPTNEVNQQELDLSVGTYRLVFVSYPDQETTYFSRLGNHYHASERSMPLRAHNYAYWETEAYKEAPEEIGVAVDTITITEEMVREGIQFIDYRDRDKYGSNEVTYTFYEVPDPMTVRLLIRATIKRRQSLKAVEASISGMADGFWLSRVIRTQNRATLYLPPDNWGREKTGEEKDSLGIIYTEIDCFGLPYGKEELENRDENDNILTFHLTLTNDSVVDFTYPVGREIEYITREGKQARIRQRQDLHDLRIVLNLSDTIIAPPTPATRTGAGFDAVVDEWEEGGTFDFGGF